MSYEFERVIDGTIQYIEKNIFSTFNRTQLFIGRLLLVRYKKNIDLLKPLLEDNALLKPLCVFDDSGKVDVKSWATDINETMNYLGKFELDIPGVGPYSFTKEDVCALYKSITGEEMQRDESY